LAGRTREFCEFLVEHGAATKPLGQFPRRVGLHSSCHALRELRLGNPSETREPERIDPANLLLSSIDDLEIVELARPDECCGFGGIFSVEEEAVSCRMGLDRLADHRAAGADVIASTDISCLLHLDGLAQRNGYSFRAMHVAEVLASSLRKSKLETGDGTADGPR
jgi:L-lactate dehydrogenase complex protein LldE